MRDNSQDWGEPIYLKSNHTIGQGLIDGGEIEIKFFCSKCNFNHYISSEVLSPYLGADKVRDSEREHHLDTIYCNCGEEFEITIFNNISDLFIDFDGTCQPEKYWYKLHPPKEYLIEDLEQDEYLRIDIKESIISDLEPILPVINALLAIEDINSNLFGFLYPVTKFLAKQDLVDEKFYLKLKKEREFYEYELLDIEKENQLKKTPLSDVKDYFKAELEKLRSELTERKISMKRDELDRNFAKLKNEKEFHTLLMRILPDLGFTACDLNHGTIEFGKDIIAISNDYFGFPECNIFIVKFGKIDKSLLRDVFNQINESINTEYEHPNYGKLKIKRIYITTNEYFTNVAKEYIKKNTSSIKQMVNLLERNTFSELTMK